MKSSLFLAAASAVLATAGPLGKRVMETDWVYEVVTVTVTAGQENKAVETPPVMNAAAAAVEPTTAKPEPPVETTPPPPPPPKPTTTSSSPPPPPPKVEKPEPKPEPKPETKSQPKQQTAEYKPMPKPTESKPESKPEPKPTSPKGSTSYQSAVLDRHNMHRSNHSASALEWDDNLASAASKLASTCQFKHDTSINGGGYGQNLAMASGGSGEDNNKVEQAITEQWYLNEMPFYSSFYGMSNPPSSSTSQTGHFTQLVWKDSTKVGCATNYCQSGLGSMPSYLTVCNYDPPGNFGGRYSSNVEQPLGLKLSINL